jgi:hypothetical protein
VNLHKPPVPHAANNAMPATEMLSNLFDGFQEPEPVFQQIRAARLQVSTK